MSTVVRCCCLVIAALFGTQAFSQSGGLALQDDVPVTVQLGASGFSTTVFFDLPESAKQFRLSIAGQPVSADVDLLLRFGQPFPNSVRNADDLFEFAQYWSISAEANEYMVVSPQSARPPRAGRWYVALVNFDSRPVTGTLLLDVQAVRAKPVQFDVRFDLPCPAGDTQCECDLAPWNDPAPGPAAPGNPGQTWGAKRRNAVGEALRQIGTRFTSESPILIQACWSDQGDDSANGVTLASAGPSDFLINDATLVFATAGRVQRPLNAKFLPEPYAFYSAAAAARLAGTDFCRAAGGACAERDVLRIEFNNKIDTPAALGTRNFYYGYDANQNFNSEPDLISVAMHELLHGLGFVSLTSLTARGSIPVGAKPLGRDDIFSRQLTYTEPPARPFMQISDAERALAMRSNLLLQWTNPETLSAATVTLLGGDLGYRMHTPDPIQAGSSVSHTSFVYRQDLMNASLATTNRALGLASSMLLPLGWSSAVRSFPPSLSIYSGLWFDTRRGGHGIDFQPVNTGSGFNRGVATFFTYSDDGQPEFYQAVGPIVDGVFIPDADINGNTLTRFVNVDGRPQPDSTQGFMRIDFNQAGLSAQCQRPAPPTGSELAAMTVVIAGKISEWCLQPLILDAQRETPDRSGLWSRTGDPGWGLSMAFISPGSLFSVLYYPDASGQPRWGFVQPSAFQSDQTLTVRQINGYCRTCADNGRPTVDIGTLKLRFEQADGVGNVIDFDVRYPGTPAAGFKREQAPLTRLSAPPRRINGS